ncbi:MAG: hypothetical protein H7Y38_04650 [Armatimonadetes bacterium]|nr:hypothetical protein [Armatimonadota bacterium]
MMQFSYLTLPMRLVATLCIFTTLSAQAWSAATANPVGGSATHSGTTPASKADTNASVSPERAVETAARFFDPLLEDAKTNAEKANILHQRGVLYLRSNCRDQALADLNRAVQLLPQNSDERSDLLFHRACVFLLLPTPDTEAALSDINICLSLSPSDVEALIVRGEAYQLSGKTALANADFARAALLAPKGDAAIRAMLQNARNRKR